MPRASAAQTSAGARANSPASGASTVRKLRPDANGTRERILDVALDLFIEKGYDKTSLREIASELGFSKAALYYHFASKDDILLALHLRLHELGSRAFARLDASPTTPADWGALLQDLVGVMLDDRKLLVLHETNRSAFDQLAITHPHHADDHADLEASFRRIVGDDRVPMVDRVRMVGALGSIIGALLLYSNTFSDTPVEEYEAVLRRMVADILPTDIIPAD